MRMPDVPAALRWLVAAVLLAGVAWALVVPAWQVPDEDAHFAYVQTLAELHRVPQDDGRPALLAGKSTEQHLAEWASGFPASVQRPEVDPSWSAAAEARWRAAEAALPPEARRDGGGATTADANPPAYYLYAAVPYELAGSADVLDRLYLVRLWSVPLLALFAVSGWLLAGELLGRDRGAQLLAGAVCGLAPMATFISAAVTPDALLYPLWGLAFWLMARVVRRGAGRRDAIALVAVALLAVAVKPVSLALWPGVVWALVAGRLPARRAIALPVAATAAGCLAAALVVPGGPRRFASYLWQFYSPAQAWAAPVPQLPPWPARDVWLEGVVGAFGWLEVRFPPWVYAGAAAVAALVLVLALRRVRPRRDGVLIVVLGLPVVALLAGLHLTEEWFLVREARGFTQGRYLLPLLPLAALAAGAALVGVPARARGVVLGAGLGLLLAAQLASLAIVAGRFYA
jgi:4-amino-4-deoxy-L-arabinose transferase-like glycosyltransferase